MKNPETITDTKRNSLLMPGFLIGTLAVFLFFHLTDTNVSDKQVMKPSPTLDGGITYRSQKDDKNLSSHNSRRTGVWKSDDWTGENNTRNAAYLHLLDLIDELEFVNTSESGTRIKNLTKWVQANREEALPAIEQFLLGDSDFRFTDENYEEVKTLRLSLLDMLAKVEDPGVIDTVIRVGEKTRSPVEMAKLLQVMQFWELPDGYRDHLLGLAEGLLSASLENEQASNEIPPLLEQIALMGDEKTLLLLQETPPQLAQYAAVALARIPDGSGVRLLSDQLMASSPDRYQWHWRVRLVAQEAARQVEARQSLLRLQEQGFLNDQLLEELMPILMGKRRYSLTKPERNRLAGIHEVSMQSGTQSIYQLRTNLGSFEEREKTLELMDALYENSTDKTVRKKIASAMRRLEQQMGS